MITKDDFYELYKKYSRLPRAGWIAKGSRKKSNETIVASRKEIVDTIDAAMTAAIGFEQASHSAAFYEKLLSAIAENYEDAVSCEKCIGVYSLGWAEGKCPYCVVEHDKVHFVVVEGD